MSNAALRIQVSALTSSISRQRLLLEDMRTRLRELQTQLDQIVYPVLTLPPEITSEIFVHCLPAERQLDIVNPKEAPLLLMHVCRLWRKIAVSTPELWTSFDLDVGWPEPNLLEVGETWFERARERPISVKLSSCGLLSDIDHIDLFMTKLWGRSRGIRELELNIAVEDFDVIDTPVPGHNFRALQFRKLQKLSVHLQEGLGGPAIDRGPLSLFHDAPILSEVLISEVPSSLITLPWAQLTQFTGEVYTIAECLEALRLMPSLTHCAFAAFDLSPSSSPRSFSQSSVAMNADPESFTHPNVRHLQLFSSTSDSGLLADSVCVLAFLTLPALQTLEIRGVKDYDQTVIDSFLSRSSPPLRRLSISPLDSQKGSTHLSSLTESFTTLPLTDLEMWYPSEDLVDALLGSLGQHASVLPQLQNLSLLGCRDTDPDLEASSSATDRVPGLYRADGCVDRQQKMSRGMHTAPVVPCPVVGIAVHALGRGSATVQAAEGVGYGYSHRRGGRLGRIVRTDLQSSAISFNSVLAFIRIRTCTVRKTFFLCIKMYY
ncbi:F-box domain-containing protein [Mycena venus]|uniref:F-box domain-containing protein n=1 Tax=Mycena venus TaxID=2733690 RepID=A0A8H6Y4B1_9AGAR|nr:F-box domain-containing protein [Mycena venus]